MSKRSVPLLIEDILSAITRIEHYAAGLSEENFLSDRKTTDAVVRNLEIIGEATNRLPIEFKDKHSDVEWPKIVGMRHRIVHDYFDVDLEIVWQILQKDLPQFKNRLQQLCPD